LPKPSLLDQAREFRLQRFAQTIWVCGELTVENDPFDVHLDCLGRARLTTIEL
jgi:hypothetical protein